jgi:DNA sulfur modification protein DndC
MEINPILLSKQIIKRTYLNDNRPWVIGYSGGKDSTTLVQGVLESIYELKQEMVQVEKPVFVIS